MSLACRSCGAGDLGVVLRLGSTPLANALLRPEDLAREEARYPLDLAFCASCSLVQITETVPPETLFRDYLYFSSFSDTMIAHSRELVARMAEELRLGPAHLAMEVASNDGYLLQFYRERGIRVLGIEPARNVAKVAIERGIATIPEFFGLELARKLGARGEKADVLHANNVLAHVADLNGFVAGIREVLQPKGVAVIEAPYLGEMIERREFDTIYHEHLCYFSMTALAALFARHGLETTEVERIPLHGGSLLLQVQHRGAAVPHRSVALLLAEEKARGVDRPAYYRDFQARTDALKDELRGLLLRLKNERKRIAAYGASAKGSTLLNYFGIGADMLDFAVDRSTYKQGRYIPGARIPISPPERLLAEMPDYALLLTWNFKDEILRQQAEYRRRGGRFIVPVPDVAVL